MGDALDAEVDIVSASTGVTLRDVCKTYGEVVAVRGADLDVTEGTVVALLGPSGSGKTTTLRLMAGFEVPDRGTVCIGGVEVAGPSTWVPPEKRRVGMVFQQLALFPHLDVGGNVGYGVRHLDKAARRARVGSLLELVGLSGYERRYPDELSGGQAQRVALARALAPEPDVVLLDEPFSSLDVSLRAGVRREVRRILRAAGATALLVTHDQDEALALGDRVAVMLEGCVAQVGRPEEVYRRPSDPAVAQFLGDANLLEGTVRGGVLDTELGPLPVGAPDGAAWGLIRPEDLDLEEDPDGVGRVIAVEYYGHDQLVTVAMPSGRSLNARLHARRRFPEGSTVRLRVGGLGVVAYPLTPHPGPTRAFPP
ncbi:MAG TPA: ABC transporter ATP-binding protein, partial [Acidimicrobiales bacterium]|nr:ABC transporter ATP-binding protein [Acidimicrobiales bacterium]